MAKQCGILDGILGQKKDISGETSEIQIKPAVLLIVMHQYWFLSFFKWLCKKLKEES